MAAIRLNGTVSFDLRYVAASLVLVAGLSTEIVRGPLSPAPGRNRFWHRIKRVQGLELLAGAHKPYPPDPAQWRCSEIKPEMGFQSTRSDTGNRSEGFEINRLIKPTVEPLERVYKACR